MPLFRMAIGFVAIAAACSGQWVGERAAGVPRLKDGAPNLAAATPKLNGKPDFTGIWQPDNEAPGVVDKLVPGIGILAVPGDDATTFPRYMFDVTSDHAPGEIKLTADAERRMREFIALGDQGYRCLPTGLPIVEMFPFPKRYVQTASMLVVIYEGEVPRQIHLDGRTLPQDPQPAWVGYSVGKWQGDTLVVETTGLNDRAPLDFFGHPKSDTTRLVERLRRRDFGHMEVEVTIEDPKFYSKPITFRYKQTLRPDDDMLEYICTENEKDAPHMQKQ